eukprot:5732511-Pleurochrysis_carterae.AAC.2
MSAGINRRWQRHAYATMGLHGRIPAGRAVTGLPRAAELRDQWSARMGAPAFAAGGSARFSRGSSSTASHNALLTRLPLGSLHFKFTNALAARWDVEDEGPVSNLLSVEICLHDKHATRVSKASYIARMLDTFMPEGVPSAFQRLHAPASDDLPNLVNSAIAAKPDAPRTPGILKAYQPLVGQLL